MKLLLQLFYVSVLLACNEQEQKTTSAQAKDTAAQLPKKVNEAMEATNDAASMVYGIDVSKYQGDEIDFLDRNKDTLSFVICKATEGLTTKDPDFSNNWAGIDARGFIRGAYHFYHSADDPVKQAIHFISAVGKFDADDFPPIIDVEEAGVAKNQTVQAFQTSLSTFLNKVKSLTGRTPILYTDHNIGNKYLSDPVFAVYPLWIAAYSNQEPSSLPGAWKGQDWVIWQKSENYKLNSTTDDFDVFNGGPGRLKNFISSH